MEESVRLHRERSGWFGPGVSNTFHQTACVKCNRHFGSSPLSHILTPRAQPRTTFQGTWVVRGKDGVPDGTKGRPSSEVRDGIPGSRSSLSHELGTSTACHPRPSHAPTNVTMLLGSGHSYTLILTAQLPVQMRPACHMAAWLRCSCCRLYWPPGGSILQLSIGLRS